MFVSSQVAITSPVQVEDMPMWLIRTLVLSAAMAVS
jgi:hypothetical protein